MKKRIILTADEGKVVTNGIRYGKVICLWAEELPEGFYEITDEEYGQLMEGREATE